MKFLIALAVLFLVAACTPLKITALQATDINNRSEVLIVRESAFTASAVNMIFGANGNDYVALANGRYSSLFLKPGSYEFFVRSDQADAPYLLNLNMPLNAVTCLRAFVNPSSASVAILGGPIGYLATRGSSTFKMEKTDCPSQEELSERKAVAVEYAE